MGIKFALPVTVESELSLKTFHRKSYLAMATYIALLRGINVGTAKRVPMEALRAILVELGYEGVVTLLNSGNAVFRSIAAASSKHAEVIAAALEKHFGFEIPVIVKSAKEFDVIVAENLLEVNSEQHSRFFVVFVQSPNALRPLLVNSALVTQQEQFVVGKSAAYLLCAGSILESRVGIALLGKSGNVVTTRNWATVLKLQLLARKTSDSALG
jgi:uncharacterized protein (DUF1697 family)